MLWSFANGYDQSPVTATDSTISVKSIGNRITPRNLVTDEDVHITLTVLCESVAARLREQKLNCSTVQISIRNHTLFSYERQMKLEYPTCLCSALLDTSFALYKKHHTSGKPIRSIGVRACDLSQAEIVQLLFDAGGN